MGKSRVSTEQNKYRSHNIKLNICLSGRAHLANLGYNGCPEQASTGPKIICLWLGVTIGGKQQAEGILSVFTFNVIFTTVSVRAFFLIMFHTLHVEAFIAI